MGSQVILIKVVFENREEIRELGFQEDRIEGEMPPAATSEGNQETLGHGP